MLAGAVLTELLLVRTFYRVGIFLPKEGAFGTVYTVLTAVGSFAFNLSSVLAVALLAWIAWRAFRVGVQRVALALGAFTVGAVAAGVSGPSRYGPLLLLLFVWAVVAVVGPFLRSGRLLALRLAAGSATAATLLAAYARLWDQLSPGVPGAPDLAGQAPAQLAAEALVLVSAVLFGWCWTREGLRAGPLAAGLVAALALTAVWRSSGATTGILVLWTAGLRLYLPAELYPLALGAVTAAAAGWRRTHPWRATGLVLLLAAGILLDTTYQLTLVVLALALLVDGEVGGRSRQGTAPLRLGGTGPGEPGPKPLPTRDLGPYGDRPHGPMLPCGVRPVLPEPRLPRAGRRGGPASRA
ncbi:MAG TPA: hypothetical protein VNO34_07635 [Actinomycetota bacterium]|nr:hypothetical protein [Actinomycetota bacterium]